MDLSLAGIAFNKTLGLFLVISAPKPHHTVDGRNPAPVDMYFIPLFTVVYTSQVVVWDFFHQQ